MKTLILKKVCCFVLYLLLIILPVFLAYGKNYDDFTGDALMATGNTIGLIAFSILVMQFVLAARFKFLDRIYGLDNVMVFHKWMGIIAFLLILLHPILLSLSYGSWFLFAFDTSWQVNLGKATFVLLLILIFMALFYRMLRLDYNIWKWLHKLAVAVLIMGFLHSFLIGEHMRNPGLRIYWITIFSIGIIIFLYRNLIVPFTGKYKFTVKSVQHETANCWQITLSPTNAKQTFSYLPGQFGFLTLKRPGRKSEEHPFTISSSPTAGSTVEFTIKESGNFTNTIGQTRSGDIALIEGPFGRFSHLMYPDNPLLFIAGGVGVTPVMSMLRYIRDTGDNRKVVFLYGVRQEENIIFKDELNKMPDNINIVYIASRADGICTCEKGHINSELIKKQAADIIKMAHVYLCGPPCMMTAVLTELHQLDISPKRIHYEKFSI